MPVKDCLDEGQLLGVSVRDCLECVNQGEKTCALWVEPFPGYCFWTVKDGENEVNTGNHFCLLTIEG